MVFFFLFLRFLRFPFDRSCETLKKEGEGEKSGEGNSRGTSAKKRRYIVLFCSCLFLRIAFQIFFFRSVEGNNGKADFPNETFSASFHIFRVQRREGGETKRAKSCDKRNHVRKNSRWIPSLHFSSSEPGALNEAKYKKINLSISLSVYFLNPKEWRECKKK